MPLDGVKNILLVLSGKGGVGKSSVTLQLALSLTLQGRSVCILDIDLTGPSMPRLVGKENAKIVQASGGWVPVSVYPASDSNPTTPAAISSTDKAEGNDDGITRPYGSLRCMSLGFLLRDRGDAVIWRGPKKTAMIRQFLSDVIWGDTDYLLIDTPPGTSDEHIAIAEQLLSQATTSPTSGSTRPRLAGAVLVTTPQAVAISDVRKGVNFCAKTNIPVLGVVENMSGYTCPCCGEVSNVFSKGGGKVMAEDMGIRFLGAIPIDVSFGEMVEGSRQGSDEDKEEQKAEKAETNGSQPQESPMVERYQKCWSQPTFESLAKEVIQLVETT
ncbi:Cytosolic Fe-S cluster assembly factor CFD1 [Trichophyton interdigitale]|uniref:Cytosolic Fe-S cluster assembly factor CFD1 n=1 Tax=Trichophyton interdigitale TaxID=101480 RepID=A0A9P4YNY3_9EURO|nr:Cytosolic Fe-S cluster assembly factor CFD1 [Trichophyton interdigitale]KAF3901025.1 Cytosolic Fe-S cluster assembly factor CFD1 [Trichophyton interdigitale]KAG8208908.1 Cytosolic Fe-S cluster assembly factor CFD1 [Trichophyton interdigitale]